ncbi:MAG: formate dehydrogenase accessory sulfurtransferase FdhD, partial [Candidatus Eiseniibacteriota bacterium]
RTLSITLRTPGHDEELALGFLAGEGLIAAREQVAEVGLRAASCSDEPDLAEISLAPGVTLDWARLERHFAATSACGLCGRAHLDALRAGLSPAPAAPPVDPVVLAALSGRARAAQETFEATGSLHAAALAEGGELAISVLREDVGRHNAVDKIAGWLVREGRYPLAGGVLWVSGRAGAEIVLKAARARIPTLAAVGAPSSLAIELAESAGMTLVGFLREGRMNVYSGLQRVASR